MLVLIVTCCISLCVRHVQADVSCTAGTFVAGSQGVVRCDFGTDVTKDKHDFNVVWYAFDHTNYDNRKNLLACSWYNGQMTCPLKASGYLFDNRVDSTLTLTIPVVDTSMAGLYRCQLVPKPPNTDMNFCNLTVIELTRNADTTDSRSQSQGNSGQAVVVLVICLVIFILLLVTAMGVLRYVRKSFSFARKNDYCPWIPDFWTLERFHRGEARMEVDAEQMHASYPASLVEQHQDVPLQVQPDATTPPLVPPRTRTRATSTNDDKDVTLNIESDTSFEEDTPQDKDKAFFEDDEDDAVQLAWLPPLWSRGSKD